MDGPRPPRADELAAAVELSGTVFGRRGPRDMGREYPTLFCRENLPHLRMFVDAGRPVALAGFTVNRVVTAGASFTVACIGSVCTLKTYQGRGLGTRLMDDCLAAALSEGATVLLVSGGRGLYRRMGCIDAGLYRTIRVPRAALSREPSRQVREWRLADVPRMAELYGAEPVRFDRTLPEWYAFLRTGQVADRPCRTWVVSAPNRPDRIEAYLCVQRTGDTPRGRAASVQETGGSREAVFAALAAVAEAMRADRIDVDSLAADGSSIAIAARLGFEAAARGFPGTVKVIDPPGIQPALRHLVGPGVSIAAGPDGFVFRLGTQSFAVRGLEEVTAFLFGSIERNAAQPGPGPLRARLEAAFPMQLPDYGLNYI
jgi:GNAT superfamily N-acetyltransferase